MFKLQKAKILRGYEKLHVSQKIKKASLMKSQILKNTRYLKIQTIKL